ncbi:Prm2p [Saccharomyces cerevisiae x Saccharomyces kudriavzevii VIN7]|uniref:Prm2p n=1 Tax=Saccharomyces cerevisiae x Saccharomyces kudriavzevii (strain VIN7) TaxID=1095631 RepID=H0GWC4_SACCK|nr:Prm2p [Saccharomyces cerevisiae x Saccharomyces kudriavzevii VIN7]
MDNVRLIKSLSLPQRLINCLFHPLLLIFFTSVILTIWGTFSVIDATMIKTSYMKIKKNDTEIATVVSISTTTATSTTTLVTTHQPTSSASIYSLNKSFIDDTLDQYFEGKVKDVASQIDTDMQEKFQLYTDNLLNNKQQLITNQISLETESMKNVLGLNNTIYNELLTKSQLINETWNRISEDAMTIDEESISQMASSLFLNYSMFDDIFQNYTTRLNFLQVFNDTITDFSLQLGTNTTFNLNFLQTSTSWDQFKKNFTETLQNEISTLSGSTTNVKPPTTLAKRSFEISEEEKNAFNAVKSRILRMCRKMTIIFTAIYVAFVVLLMIIERIIFQLENQQINLVMSQINNFTGYTSFTQYNTIVRGLIATLNLCVLYPFPYHFTKLINQKILKRGPEQIDGKKVKRSKLFYCSWWVFSNGVHLWLFGLLMLLVHWQIVSRLTSFEVPYSPKLDKRADPLLYKREVWTETNTTTAVEGLINDSISLLCENFQLEVNERLVPDSLSFPADHSFKNQSMNILSLWVNDTNTQFEKYLNESSQDWNGIDLSIGPLVSTDSLTEFMDQYSMPTNKLTKTNASFALDIQKYGIIIQGTNVGNNSVGAPSSLAKRHEVEHEQIMVSSLHTVYKWGLLIICLTILLHHTLTFIILKL